MSHVHTSLCELVHGAFACALFRTIDILFQLVILLKHLCVLVCCCFCFVLFCFVFHKKKSVIATI
jgi:hypothetical protein